MLAGVDAANEAEAVARCSGAEIGVPASTENAADPPGAPSTKPSPVVAGVKVAVTETACALVGAEGVGTSVPVIEPIGATGTVSGLEQYVDDPVG